MENKKQTPPTKYSTGVTRGKATQIEEPKFFYEEGKEFILEGEQRTRRINTIVSKGGQAYVYLDNGECQQVYRFYINRDGEEVAFFKNKNGEEQKANPKSKFLFEARTTVGIPISADEYENF